MITIVDYQMGNLRSVQKAIEKIGFQAQITADPQTIARADQLILPGVGGFGEAIAEIRRRDLEQPILDFIASGRPFLGICLGLQLLFDTGYEGGTHRGLGVLPGEVVRFPLDLDLKVPHMGWNTVHPPGEPESITQSLQTDQRELASSRLLIGLEPRPYFYFVHSYYVVPAEPQVIALQCQYGFDFCAMVQRGNLFATQFHPEKSQANGLRLLANFASLTDQPVHVASEINSTATS
jgi:glutamine amidotransferase